MDIKNRLGVLAVVCLGAATPLAVAGDPTPPPGPIGPTMKTLDEVEPSTPISAANTPGDATATHVITQPGAYHLTGDLTAELAKDGIRVEASDVRIDLRGFTMWGLFDGDDAIVASTVTSVDRCVVANGTLSRWNGYGVDIRISNEALVQNVNVDRCSVGGIIANERSVVRECWVGQANGFGIEVDADSVVERCHAVANFGGGFTGTLAVFRECVALDNLSGGFAGGSFDRCQARGGLVGFDSGLLAVECVAADTAVGFQNVRQARSCLVVGSEDGYAVPNGGVLERCSFMESTSALGDAFILAGNATITGCHASGAFLSGIDGAATSNNVIRDCEIIGATLTAVLLPGFNNSVLDTVVIGAGASGINIGERSRVIGCVVRQPGARGVDAGASSSVIVRDCQITGAGTEGVLILGTDNSVINTTVIGAGADGIRLEERSLVRACRVEAAGINGILGGRAIIVEDTSVTNLAEAGIRLGNRARVERCTVQDPGLQGIVVAVACRVVDNLVANAGHDGIVADRQSRIEGNHVDLAGVASGYDGACVYTLGVSNRIHNNSLTRGDWCLRTGSGFNAITENSYSGWGIAATNLTGPNTLGTNYNH